MLPPLPSCLFQVSKAGERLNLEWDRGRIFDLDVATMYCQMVSSVTVPQRLAKRASNCSHRVHPWHIHARYGIAGTNTTRQRLRARVCDARVEADVQILREPADNRHVNVQLMHMAR